MHSNHIDFEFSIIVKVTWEFDGLACLFFTIFLFLFLGSFSYIIPVPVIRHFISGVEENGSYVGFCSMGLSCQPTENLQLREYFQMGPELTGVLVSKINPLSDAYKVLRKDDIILSFDGIPIANDGTGTLFGHFIFCISSFTLKKICI